jgi:hypothetical protein
MNGLNAFERQYRTTGAGAMIAQSVADILSHHVKLSVEGIDRMYLNIYVPQLQREQGIVWFFRGHRGLPVPSAAVMSPMSRSFVTKVESYAAHHTGRLYFSSKPMICESALAMASSANKRAFSAD